MHYALIENSIVAHVLRVPPSNIYPPSMAEQYVTCGEDVQIGWLVVDGALVPPPAPAPQIPQEVTMRQARLALLGAGLLSGVDAAIASLPSPTKEAASIEWEYAAVVQRSSGLVPAMATALGMTSEQIDALFVAAAAL